MSDTQETDVSACIHHAEETPYDDWVYAGHAKLIARERDTMKAERNQFMNALNRVKKELVSANRGAETNAKVNQGLCARLEEAQRERDEALKEWDNARALCDSLLSQRDEARRHLAAANKGAETNAKVNQGLYARLTEAERELEWARRERDEARREIEKLREEQEEEA